MKKIITILFTLALAFTMVACGGKKVDIKKDKELLIEELTGIKYDKGIILEGSYSLKSLTTDLVKNEVIGEATTKIALTTDAKTSILNIDMNMPTYGVDTKYNYYILENGKMYMDSKSNMFGEVIEEKVELEDIDDVEYGDILSEIPTDFSIDEYLKDAELMKVLMELDALKIYKQDEKLIIEFKINKKDLLAKASQYLSLYNDYTEETSLEEFKKIIETQFDVLKIDTKITVKDKNIEKVSIKGEVKTSSEETDPFSDLTYKAETEISFELKSVNDLPKLLSFADYEKIEIVEKED